MKIRPMRTELFYAGGQTDGQRDRQAWRSQIRNCTKAFKIAYLFPPTYSRYIVSEIELLPADTPERGGWANKSPALYSGLWIVKSTVLDLWEGYFNINNLLIPSYT
jgi:hypothetical protein